jgi:hypothetical protein
MSAGILMPDEMVASKIHLVRNQKVMLDDDLAELYQVETRRLNEQVIEISGDGNPVAGGSLRFARDDGRAVEVY